MPWVQNFFEQGGEEPYAALAQGLTECSWGRLWIEARRECGLTFGQGLRLDEWGTSPMGAAEAAASWLSGLRAVGDGQILGSHSLKGHPVNLGFTIHGENRNACCSAHIQPEVKSLVTFAVRLTRL